MDEITDILYLNSNEKVQVTTDEENILLKNENIDIKIAYDEIFNYTIEKECISLYMYSNYYEKVKEIINNKQEHNNNYIIVKLYYKDSTNKILSYFDKLIKEHYKKEVEEGYIFADSENEYTFTLKCGFDDKKNSKINADIWGGLSITLCKKDYYNRLKKSSFVPVLLWAEYENIVSVELNEDCLKILIYFDEYDNLEKIVAAEFYTMITSEKDYLKIELTGDKESLSKFKSRVEPYISFVSPVELKLRKERREKYRKEYEEENRREYEETLRKLVPPSNTAYENNCIIMAWIGVISVMVGVFAGIDFLTITGAVLWLLYYILMAFKHL